MVPKGRVNIQTPLTDVWKTLMPINTSDRASQWICFSYYINIKWNSIYIYILIIDNYIVIVNPIRNLQLAANQKSIFSFSTYIDVAFGYYNINNGHLLCAVFKYTYNACVNITITRCKINKWVNKLCVPLICTLYYTNILYCYCSFQG